MRENRRPRGGRGDGTPGIAFVASLIGLPLYFLELRGRGRVPAPIVRAVAVVVVGFTLSWCWVPVQAWLCVDDSPDGRGPCVRWALLRHALAGFEQTTGGQWDYEPLWLVQIPLQVWLLAGGAGVARRAARRTRWHRVGPWSR